MTAAQMLTEVRTLLDEDIEEYFLDTEIYSALTDGQKEYASIVYAIFETARKLDRNTPIPLTLLPLFTESGNIPVTSGAHTISLTSLTSLWKVIYVTFGTSKIPLLERDLSSVRPFRQSNSIMNALDTFYSVTSTNIELENSSSDPTTNYQVAYLTETTTIDGTPTNPILPDWTHKAIVQYAYSEMLKKPKLLNEALAAFNQFIQMIQYK
jgi:hypothetical protein